MKRPSPAAGPRSQTGCEVGDLFRLLGEPHVLDLLWILISRKKPLRFVELQNELKLSPNTLTDRLKGLVGAGLLRRTAFQEIPPRVEYEATPKAYEFDALFQGLSEWAKHHDLTPEPAPGVVVKKNG